MNLTVVIGSTVVLDILGHSASNGASLGVDSVITLSSNAPEVATVPGTVPGTAENQIIDVPVTIVGTGSTDIKVAVSPKDSTGPFEDIATLLVTPLPVPGLARVELVLRQTV